MKIKGLGTRFAFFIYFVLFSNLAKAQTVETKPANYIKIEMVHGDFGAYEAKSKFNDLTLELEHRMAQRHLTLQGFSVGYRKEGFSNSSYGHFVNAKVFWRGDTPWFGVKSGVGIEWGMPSPRHDQT